MKFISQIDDVAFKFPGHIVKRELSQMRMQGRRLYSVKSLFMSKMSLLVSSRIGWKQ
jgi:hypothetical protein